MVTERRPECEKVIKKCGVLWSRCFSVVIDDNKLRRTLEGGRKEFRKLDKRASVKGK